MGSVHEIRQLTTMDISTKMVTIFDCQNHGKNDLSEIERFYPIKGICKIVYFLLFWKCFL